MVWDGGGGAKNAASGPKTLATCQPRHQNAAYELYSWLAVDLCVDYWHHAPVQGTRRIREASMRLLLCAALSHALIAPISRAPPRRGTHLNSRLDDADALEIRLDVTVLWCQCLARELSRELAAAIKQKQS